MTTLRLPADYRPALPVLELEGAIKGIKDFFEQNLAEALGLVRVTAPLFVRAGTGVNDDLNGVEQPVRFAVAGDGGAEAAEQMTARKAPAVGLDVHGKQGLGYRFRKRLDRTNASSVSFTR